MISFLLEGQKVVSVAAGSSYHMLVATDHGEEVFAISSNNMTSQQRTPKPLSSNMTNFQKVLDIFRARKAVASQWLLHVVDDDGNVFSFGKAQMEILAWAALTVSSDPTSCC